LLEPGNKRSISQGRVEQTVIDKNFWENYERNLGIVKEENAEESPNIRPIHTSPGQNHYSEDEVQANNSMLNPQDMVTRFSDHSLTRDNNDNKSGGQSAEEPGENQSSLKIKPVEPESDSEDGLPLF
jgi:hypothetical protein